MSDQELKQAFVSKLRGLTIPAWLDDVDPRIAAYIRYVRDFSEGENDRNCIDQVAMCCKFIRMCNVYRFDAKYIQRYIKMAEHFKLDSLDGNRAYPMTPAQVFIVCGLHAFEREVDVEILGEVRHDVRKVVQDAILFVARKFGKTQIDAWEACWEFMMGPNDAEVHIVSNSLDQSNIAYRAIKAMLVQLDPDGQQLRLTQKEVTWRTGRLAAIYPHTAGATTKDGAKASLVIADEYGSAKYVKDTCLMSNALEVYLSSMGTRKDHLSIISTTAGRVIEGPFETLMNAQQQALYETELGAGMEDKFPSDSQFLYACHTDKWETSEEYFSQERIWRKCNPHIGVSIQPEFYQQEWDKTQNNPEHLKEVKTKLFNIFVSDSSRPWIQAEDIRRLQTPMRITDLRPEDGWICFVGADFSHGDDLHTLGYHCVCMRNPKSRFHGMYFWDTDVWIAEEQLLGNPNAALYRRFIEQGDMHTSPTKVIPSGLLVERLEVVNRHAPIVRFGFDAYDATDNLNDIRTWFVQVAKQRGASGRSKIEEFLKMTVIPVSQTWASYNAPTTVAWKMVNATPCKVMVSRNEVLPWVFGNAMLDVDKNDNCKPIKRTANAKVDPVQAIISGMKMEMDARG